MDLMKEIGDLAMNFEACHKTLAAMEICFLSQCREGEALSVRSREAGSTIYMAAVHADESIAAVCLFSK